MANEWRAHVKKTMDEMKKSAPKGVTIMLKDVLKKAKVTYKKGVTKASNVINANKTTKRKVKGKKSKGNKTKKRKTRRRGKK